MIAWAVKVVRHPAVVLALFSTVLLAQSCWFASRHSLTYDETIYLNLSLQSVHDGRLDPDFASLGIAPLPVLLTYVPPLLAAPRQAREAESAGHLDDPSLIRAPRFLNSLLIGVPLIVTVFLWLRRHGLLVASLGAGLAAFSPTLVAHSSVATTDASLALFSTLGIAAIAWLTREPNAMRFLICAGAIAAAMSAKYSGVFLLPVATGMLLISSIGRSSDRSRLTAAARAIGRTSVLSALLIVVVFPLWWGAHLFTRTAPLDRPHRNSDQSTWSVLFDREVVADFFMGSAPVAGLRHQLGHSQGGDEAFLMGERADRRGWWYYFPFAYAFKSTPSELAATAFLLALLAAASRHPWKALMHLEPSMQCLLLSSVVLMGGLLTSHLNLGHRYMIALYPIVIIAACDRLAVRLRGRRRWLAAASVILLALQASSSLWIAPHYLAYINAPSGGPANGWRLLADSNVDWGQDLPSLRTFLETHADGPVALKYFGSALPEAYGIVADDLGYLRRKPDEYAFLAVSATLMDGLYLGGRDPFKDFRRLEPAAQPGYSIMVYDLRQPEALAAFRETLKVLR